MSKSQRVERPLKRVEYEIVFLTRNARQGWQDCLAVARNATVDAWNRLTTAPMRESERLYRLKGDYATGTFQGETFERYQYKITNGGRYFVQSTPGAKVAGRVLLERAKPATPRKPNAHSLFFARKLGTACTERANPKLRCTDAVSALAAPNSTALSRGTRVFATPIRPVPALRTSAAPSATSSAPAPELRPELPPCTSAHREFVDS